VQVYVYVCFFFVMFFFVALVFNRGGVVVAVSSCCVRCYHGVHRLVYILWCSIGSVLHCLYVAITKSCSLFLLCLDLCQSALSS